MAQAAQERDNPKAEQAFLDYIELGESRSLKDLANRYQTATDPPSKRLKTLADWSRRYDWQSRIATARSQVAAAKLQEAADLDAGTFLVTSRNLRHQATHYKDFPDTTIKIRESVRKPMPKSGASVDLTISLTVQQQEILQRVADRRGLSVDDLLTRTNQLVAGDC